MTLHDHRVARDDDLCAACDLPRREHDDPKDNPEMVFMPKPPEQPSHYCTRCWDFYAMEPSAVVDTCPKCTTKLVPFATEPRETATLKAAHTQLLDLILSKRYSAHTLQTAIRALITAARVEGVEQNTSSYLALVEQLRTAPATWIPSLLRTLIKRGLAVTFKGVHGLKGFVDDCCATLEP